MVKTTNKDRKTILITGCSSGIGYTAAKELSARGYQVFAAARKSADVDRLKREGLTTLQLDLDDTASIEQALASTLEQTGGQLYALINNAAFAVPGAVEDLNRDAMRQQFETNVFGTMELTNRAIALMRRQGYGRIIMVSSILGRVSMPYRGAYNASKYALEGFCDTLRLELHKSGIRLSVINPGPIESRFRENAIQTA
ncbi:MAG: SDR family NAD(P)-dependent oxidoreductase, partial [Gammaproteobacteria bacterium]|nr:SDR family NAD(P)-dependent oxidoreductase [Gammaproteobacteria bacterium]